MCISYGCSIIPFACRAEKVIRSGSYGQISLTTSNALNFNLAFLMKGKYDIIFADWLPVNFFYFQEYFAHRYRDDNNSTVFYDYYFTKYLKYLHLIYLQKGIKYGKCSISFFV